MTMNFHRHPRCQNYWMVKMPTSRLFANCAKSSFYPLALFSYRFFSLLFLSVSEASASVLLHFIPLLLPFRVCAHCSLVALALVALVLLVVVVPRTCTLVVVAAAVAATVSAPAITFARSVKSSKHRISWLSSMKGLATINDEDEVVIKDLVGPLCDRGVIPS